MRNLTTRPRRATTRQNHKAWSQQTEVGRATAPLGKVSTTGRQRAVRTGFTRFAARPPLEPRSKAAARPGPPAPPIVAAAERAPVRRLSDAVQQARGRACSRRRVLPSNRAQRSHRMGYGAARKKLAVISRPLWHWSTSHAAALPALGPNLLSEVYLLGSLGRPCQHCRLSLSFRHPSSFPGPFLFAAICFHPSSVSAFFSQQFVFPDPLSHPGESSWPGVL